MLLAWNITHIFAYMNVISGAFCGGHIDASVIWHIKYGYCSAFTPLGLGIMVQMYACMPLYGLKSVCYSLLMFPWSSLCDQMHLICCSGIYGVLSQHVLVANSCHHLVIKTNVPVFSNVNQKAILKSNWEVIALLERTGNEMFHL